jgi:hypothetical protein
VIGLDQHVVAGGRHEHAAAVERQLVLDLTGRQRAGAVEQRRQAVAGVLGAVQDDQDGNGEVGGQAAKNRHDGLQAAPGGSDDHELAARHGLRR